MSVLSLNSNSGLLPLFCSDKVIRLTPKTEEEAFVLKNIYHRLQVTKCALVLWSSLWPICDLTLLTEVE